MNSILNQNMVQKWVRNWSEIGQKLVKWPLLAQLWLGFDAEYQMIWPRKQVRSDPKWVLLGQLWLGFDAEYQMIWLRRQVRSDPVGPVFWVKSSDIRHQTCSEGVKMTTFWTTFWPPPTRGSWFWSANDVQILGYWKKGQKRGQKGWSTKHPFLRVLLIGWIFTYALSMRWCNLCKKVVKKGSKNPLFDPFFEGFVNRVDI